MQIKFNVLDFGVQPNITTLQTEQFQAALNACQHNGGEVIVPAGRYYIGSLRLYSNTTFHLQANAQIYGSRDYHDYTDFHVPTSINYLHDPYYIKKWHLPVYYFYGLLCAFNEQNITIIGDENAYFDGQDTDDPNGEEGFRGPMGIILSHCQHIKLAGYTIRNSANWAHTLDACRDIKIDQVTVLAGHDGFDLHHSQQIKIQNCRLKTGDDCIAGYDIADLKVQTTLFNTACNALRIGGQRLNFTNCQFVGPGEFSHLSEETKDTHAFFKHYAMAADPAIAPSQQITFTHCQFKNARRLLVYQFGSKDLMQDGQPLFDLSFIDCRISSITQTAVLKGRGQLFKLDFVHTVLSNNEELLVQGDSDVQVNVID